MRIHVHRTGGFAGIERQAEVDTEGLADEEEWEALAMLALQAPPPDPSGHQVRDGFSYRITVDGRTVSCADPHVTEAQRRLIRRVLKEGA
ncbi:protealysin inhibitor emfourin [Streptomyces sp. NPDC089799]|uniref:protealysin inhibitor emfourin n=1 Tax=Streptomyces sp. NPDC089799 TaxID=3155066 RepID=UPI0034447B45